MADRNRLAWSLSQALARSGKLDQAVTILLPMVGRKTRVAARSRASPAPEDDPPAQGPAELAGSGAISARGREGAPPGGRVAHPTPPRLARRPGPPGRRPVAPGSSVLAKDPRNLSVSAGSGPADPARQGQGLRTARVPEPASHGLQIIDQAEKDLGPSLDIQLARLDYWGLEGGDAAQAAVAKLAEARQQILPPPTGPRSSIGSRRPRSGSASRSWRGNTGASWRLSSRRTSASGSGSSTWPSRPATRTMRPVSSTRSARPKATRGQLAVRAGGAPDRQGPPRCSRAPGRGTRSWPWKSPSGVPNGRAASRSTGEIAELAGSPDQAITSYLRAVELGNVQPSLVRRLVGLLNERNRFDEIDHVAQVLRDQGAALDEITIVKALDAIRKQDFDRGIALARQVFPESSTNSSDHLTLGRFYMAAGRSDEAGKEFRRAVELGPGFPTTG